MLVAEETSQGRQAQIASVLKLIDRVISLRGSWDTVSEVEWRLLNEVGFLTGQRVPAGAYNSASALLGFLVLVRFLLKRRARLFTKANLD